ncbi:THI80 [[Candida] subhashii]|uniref:Thiamine pyrophosphokinase n=1 Tax=[Candida] subhashii TaxID=561895 RepID=A0A8J5QQS8_9ASCO|nr:THI80 [[Candida] subhashii]KAG7665863.1 THI80 [[Candida] subhashii]
MSSKQAQLKEEVTVQPDALTVRPPPSPTRTIEPFNFLLPTTDSNFSTQNQALIILNQKIDVDIINIWHKCELIVCADGGANRLFDYFNDYDSLPRSKYIPQYIVGDLDSIRPDVSDYYSSQGSRVILQSSQFSNDFDKAIVTIQLHYALGQEQKSIPDDVNDDDGLSVLWDELLEKNKGEAVKVKIFVMNGIGGRFDQTIHSISQLYILARTCPNLDLLYITRKDVIFLIHRGLNYIKFDSREVFHKARGGDGDIPACGLLPLGNNEVVLSTYGLKYDVTRWRSDMLGKVSTSNYISGVDGFTVDASDDIVMNIAITL